MKIKFNSIKFKMSILHTIILGVILIVYSSILYFDPYYALCRNFDKELRIKAQEISDTLSSYLNLVGSDRQSFIFAAKRVIGEDAEHFSQDKQDKIKELEKKWLPRINKLGLKIDYINFLGPKGEIIVNSSNLEEELLLKLIKNKEDGFRNLKFKDYKLRTFTLPFTYREEKYKLQLTTPVKPIICVLKNRLLAILISFPIVLLLISFVGRLFAVKILRPIKEVSETARRITHEDLSSRVEIKHLDEEMKSLVAAFNNMISRLEGSFKYITEFSSHVAHELKTPLAIIRGESEVALRKERNLEEYQRVIEANLNETERMIKTVDDILLLAKLDYQPQLFKFEQLDLVPFLKEIYEQSKILASKKDIIININILEEPMNISANKFHLRRLFFNLLHNAIKFNSTKGRIDIIAKYRDKKVLVAIKDTGVGIAEKDLPKIFDKFFHAEIEKIDQEIEPGSGLGLTIAQSIAKIHQGEIKAESQPGEGATFTVILPTF